MEKQPVLAIVGPTAVGKSALALAVAEHLPVEILCMDSMQVYRRMDIGTAKPTREEQRAVPHHMLDVAEPTDAFSVAQYVDMVKPLLRAVGLRGKVPLLVGGTGLYLKALLEGLPLGGATGNEELRESLHRIAGEPEGHARLHAMLAQVDPQAAERLHPHDLRRVIRALEVFEAMGKPMSQHNESVEERDFVFGLLGATLERETLYLRVNQRVDAMMTQGLAQEVESLLQSGVDQGCQSMQGIGYKELVPMLRGHLSKEDAVELMKRNTRRYVKRQWTWFSKVEGIRWLDMGQRDATAKAVADAHSFWEKHRQ